MFFSWMLIFTNFVPISLLVTLEMVKFVQGIFIALDLNLYYEPSDIPAEVHASNLNEELGQIAYVFSDKTGTLTCNRMEFRRCSIRGRAYGTEQHVAPAQKLAHVDFVDAQLDCGAECVQEFFLHLALCHTVIAGEGLEYKASSPDELALVNAARYFGVVFLGRDAQQNLELQVNGESRLYALLCVLEFNSDRKRMSVVVRTPEKRVLLICKGADSMILPRITQTETLARTLAHLEEFGNEGLRTLLIASRELHEDEYSAWSEEFLGAMRDIHHRESRLAALGEAIECNLELIGATAIEDKLQDNVPATIETLQRAGVKV